MSLTFGSLFAGIGGFDLGFERAGMVCKWQVEIDEYANKVLRKHWPTVHRERDIRQCGRHNLERVDVICGGFPCQDISYAGRGAGLAGERSGLFFEAVRVVRELRPRVVVLENVAALLTRGLDRVLGTLAEVGYGAEWHCIPAAYVGAPHIRDRVFLVGYSNSSGRQTRKQAESSVGYRSSAKSAGRHAGAMANADSRNCHDARHGAIAFCWKRESPEVFRHSSNWLTEPAVGRVADGVSNRVDRLRGLGNAVVPQVAEFIGQRIVRAIPEEEK